MTDPQIGVRRSRGGCFFDGFLGLLELFFREFLLRSCNSCHLALSLWTLSNSLDCFQDSHFSGRGKSVSFKSDEVRSLNLLLSADSAPVRGRIGAHECPNSASIWDSVSIDDVPGSILIAAG